MRASSTEAFRRLKATILKNTVSFLPREMVDLYGKTRWHYLIVPGLLIGLYAFGAVFFLTPLILAVLIGIFFIAKLIFL